MGLSKCPKCGSIGERGSICQHPEPIGDHYRSPIVITPEKPYDWENDPENEHWTESLSETDDNDELDCSCVGTEPCKECLEAVINAAEWFTYYTAEEA